MTIIIKQSNNEQFLAKIDKLKNIFEAEGKTLEVKEISRGREKVHRGTDWSTKQQNYKWSDIEYETIEYEITGDLESRGYYIVGLVEQQSDSVTVETLVENVEGHRIKIPQRFYDMSKIECDECHQNRFRKTGEIVYNPNTNEYLCIGTGCINDFMGFPVDLINKLFALKDFETDNSKPKETRAAMYTDYVYDSEEVFALTDIVNYHGGVNFLTCDIADTLADIHWCLYNGFDIYDPEVFKQFKMKRDIVTLFEELTKTDTHQDYEEFCKWLLESKKIPWVDKELIENAENCLLSEKITLKASEWLIKAINAWYHRDTHEKNYQRKLRLEAKYKEFESAVSGDIREIIVDKDSIKYKDPNERYPGRLESETGQEYCFWNNNVFDNAEKIGDDKLKIKVRIKDRQIKYHSITIEKIPETTINGNKSKKTFIHYDNDEEIMIEVKSVELENTKGYSYTATMTDSTGRKYTYNFNTAHAPKNFKNDIQRAQEVKGFVAVDHGDEVKLNGWKPLTILKKVEESTELFDAILNLEHLS